MEGKGTWKHRKESKFPPRPRCQNQNQSLTRTAKEVAKNKSIQVYFIFCFTLIASFTMHCIACGVLPHDNFAGALHFISIIFQIMFYKITVHCHSLSNKRLHVARGSSFW